MTFRTRFENQFIAKKLNSQRYTIGLMVSNYMNTCPAVSNSMDPELNVLVDAKKIIQDYVRKTPLELSKRLSRIYDCNVYLKREDMQEVRSFKIRGAVYNILTNLDTIRSNEMEVVCASAGNHAQGVAISCNKLNIKCHIFVPTTTPLQKKEMIEYYGETYCEVHIAGETFDACLDISKKYCKENKCLFIHPFDDINTVIGQSTVTQEICEDIGPDIIVYGIGGGGLISGSVLYKQKAELAYRIIGAEPETCPSMKLALSTGKPIVYDSPDMFVDGATVRRVGDITFDICNNSLTPDDIVVVPIGKICEDILNFHNHDGIVAEPAGVLSVSALQFLPKEMLKGKNIVCIISGGNNDVLRYPEIFDKLLRYKNLLWYYIVSFTQKPGELKRYVNDVVGPDVDITRFEYLKKTNKDYGDVLIGVRVKHPGDNIVVENNMQHNGFKFTNINESEQLFRFLV